MQSKYEVSLSYGSKLMAKIKVFCHRHTDRQTGQNLDDPEFHPGGIKIKAVSGFLWLIIDIL